jgi:hypothetical protein
MTCTKCVGTRKGLDAVVRRDPCFHRKQSPGRDQTELVLTELVSRELPAACISFTTSI